jgi:hypothetical protein
MVNTPEKSKMQTNQKRPTTPRVKTHEGAAAVRASAYAQLRRAVLNCLLWEDSFYESGQSISSRITALVPQVDATAVFNLAIEARNDFGLRHVPLLLALCMARGTPEYRKLVSAVLPAVINRPDEIAEFTSMYWLSNNGKRFITHPIRRGIENALNKFSAFQIAKWDRKDKGVRIRDAMFMAHVMPNDVPTKWKYSTRVGPDGKKHTNRRRVAVRKWGAAERKADKAGGETRAWPFTERETIQFQVAQDLLVQQGTWEDRMSAGEPAKVVFSDLMEKGRLGSLAFIRNVRKMTEAGIEPETIRTYSMVVSLHGIFPHQLLTAARYNPAYEDMFDKMMRRALEGLDKLPGKTAVLVDVSGSMNDVLAKNPAVGRRASAASVEQTTRLDAASAVAIMVRELSTEVRIFTFSDAAVELPNRHGMALRDAITESQPHRSTHLAAAISAVNQLYKYDRIVVVTDEQSHDGISPPLKGTRAYMMNVAAYDRSVATKGEWIGISGWSPQIVRYINQLEAELNEAVPA